MKGGSSNYPFSTPVSFTKLFLNQNLSNLHYPNHLKKTPLNCYLRKHDHQTKMCQADLFQTSLSQSAISKTETSQTATSKIGISTNCHFLTSYLLNYDFINRHLTDQYLSNYQMIFKLECKILINKITFCHLAFS